MIFARVAVNLPAVSGEFDYRLPETLAGRAAPGSLLTVPFGNQVVQGVILELLETPAVENPRAALELLAPEPILTAEQIALARALAAQTLQPLALFIGAMIPAGLNQHADTLFTLTGSPAAPEGKIAQRLFTLLTARGALRGRQIDAHFARVEWRAAAETLVKHGWLKKEAILPPAGARPKFIRAAQLMAPPEKFAEILPTLGKTEATRARRAAALQILLREATLVPVQWLYAESGCTLADLQLLDELGLIALTESEIFRDPLRKISADELLRESAWAQLTAEQQKAWEQIEAALRGSAPQQFLLHGVTASGKTELYLRAARETLQLGKTALILVPEIALTPQLVRRFLARFPGQVGILHSKLSPGERYDTWRRVRSGALSILLGARSALFAPLPRLGLIVLDECHDPSYYQSEPPFYHALRAAPLYGKICGALTLLGSATPPVETRFHAQRGELGLLELPQRVTSSGLPPVQIVNMKEELQAGNRSIFSRALAESLAETLERGEQAILYLNRRGAATYVFCRDCGHSLDCPTCGIPLTQHLQSANLICHRCGYTRLMPKTCPHCKSAQIRAYGLGSEKVESEVQALLPGARVLRWDADSTHGRDAHELILTHFAKHQADILVGTQMLAKGLDLPLVTLVGAVLAEVGLALPDPFAGERVFQLLTQVAGRAGRSALGGKVILQTFLPENPVIQFAARHDYAGFYEWEIKNRRELGYPPFWRLARLEFRHRDEAEAGRQAGALAARLKDSGAEVMGAAPCFFAKDGDFFRWQVLLRAADPAALLREFRLPDGWRVEVEPVNLL
ncbi:MAG: primosomal protein N' [Anaerolineales bacterium]